MNNLDFVIDRSRKEGISDMGNAYFPSHFLGAVCGWPGSGKTTLIKYILKSPALLYDKFDEILILSPSIAEWKDLFLPSMNLANDLDFSFITNHIKRINEENRKNYVNVLIIFDDLIAQMAKNSNSEQIRKLAFNRRHLID
jgi:excinuclease UvrABC ATPase subunit